MPEPSHPSVYDSIGHGYARLRQPDPRIAARIGAALGAARTVCNVGAGAGSYEPDERLVTAIEPSATMIAQRAAGSARVVRGVAERLPFRDRQFDAAMAVLTVHHWLDLDAGLREMRRVAGRVVVFTFDPALQDSLWLIRDYFPEVVRFEDVRHPPLSRLADVIGADRIEPVPIPWDCTDGFQAAYWRRPERYLDPVVRAGISTFAQHGEDALRTGVERLARDLESGEWQRRHRELLTLNEMDFGYRLIVCEA